METDNSAAKGWGGCGSGMEEVNGGWEGMGHL